MPPGPSATLRCAAEPSGRYIQSRFFLPVKEIDHGMIRPRDRRIGPTRAAAAAGALGTTTIAALVMFAACKPGGPTDPGEQQPPPSQTFSVVLEWNAPTEDAEGGPLDDLAGYRVHYRASSPANGPGATSVEVGDATLATVSGVPAGSWRFGVTARDVSGNESALSNEVQVEVGP